MELENQFVKYKLPWFIIITGIGIRLFHFIDNRSLWYDEAHIALNLIYRDFVGLANPPLYYDQQTPIGFLWIVKSITIFCEINECALRFFPLICGIASLILFYYLVNQLFSSVEINVTLTCLAFAPPVVYHAVEMKQYETELMVTITAFLSHFYFKNKINYLSMLAWEAIGSVLIWFSLTLIFILGKRTFPNWMECNGHS